MTSGDEPSDVVDELLRGPQRSYVARAFVELALPELLSSRPLALDALADAARADPATLHRLLRTAEAVGLCRQTDAGEFALTKAGRSLHPDAPGNAAGWLMLMTSPWVSRAWERLADATRSGMTQFGDVHGMGFWEYVADHPDEGAIFDAMMSSGARERADDLLRAIDFSEISVVVDVGGGEGVLAAQLVSSTPRLRAVVADRPEVVATPADAALTLGDRIEFLAGDFFTEVPQGGDLYVLSRVVHDWPDAAAVVILQKCRAAMRDDALLCLLEHIAPHATSLAADEQLDLAIKDLNMLVLVGGCERSLADYESLLRQAGFAIVSVHHGSACDAIVAGPREGGT